MATGGSITITGSISAPGRAGGLGRSERGGNGGTGGNLTLTAGGSIMTGSISAPGGVGGRGDTRGGDGGTGGNPTLMATSGNITITGSISLRGGAGGSGQFDGAGRGGNDGNLILTAASISNSSATRTLTAGTVSLTQMGAFADNLFTIAASVDALTLETTGSSVAQTVHAWMVGGTNRALSLTTTGALTIGRDINTGTSALTLTAASISNGSATRTLTAGTVSLTQMGAFADNLFTIAASVDALTLETTGTDIDQTVHAWMVGGTNRALSLTTTGALTIGRDINTGTSALTLSGGSIVLGGDIKLDGGVVTLTGAIDEAGENESDNDALTVTATDALTLNDNINTGTGDLTLNSASIVLRGGRTTILNGGSIDLTGSISASGGAGGDSNVGGRGGDGGNLTLTATSGNITITGSLSAPGGIGGQGLNEGGRGGNGGTGGNLNLTATGSITITGSISASGGSGGRGSLVGGVGGTGGTSGNLTLTAGGSITAGSIYASGGFGGRNGSGVGRGGNNGGTGGNLTLTAGGSIMTGSLSASGGIGGTSGSGLGDFGHAGNLNLTAGTSGTGNIVSSAGIRTLTADTVSLTQPGAFGSTAQFRFGSSIDALTLETTGTDIDQTVHDWMVGGTNRALSITTTGALTIGRDINTGTSDLTLSGASIVLRGGSTTMLNGGSIDLTGSISAPGGRGATGSGIRGGTGGTGGNLTLTATSGNITITGSISAPGGTGGMGRFTGGAGGTGGTLTLIANSGSITITGSISAPGGVGDMGVNKGGDGGTGGNLTLTAGGSITITGSISAPGGTGGSGRILGGDGGTGGNLTLTAGGSITTGSISTHGGAGGSGGSRFSRGDGGNGGNLTLSGTSIVLGGTAPITLTGGAITLTGMIDESGAGGNNSLTVTATGALTLHDNINTGTGALTLSGTSIVLGGARTTILGARTNILNGGSIDLTGSISAPGGVGSNGGTRGGRGDHGGILTLMATSGDITITGSFSAPGGAGGNGDDFGGGGGNGGRLNLMATSGNITITGSFSALGGVGGMGGFVGGRGGDGGRLTLMAGGNITITGSFSAPGGVGRFGDFGGGGGDGGNLILTATGNITITGSISSPGGIGGRGLREGGIGGDGGRLTLMAGGSITTGSISAPEGVGGNGINGGVDGTDGTGGNLDLTAASISNGGATRTLTVGTVSLTQMGAFTETAPFMLAASVSALTLETTGTDIDQTVHAWMVGGTNRRLSITTTGALIIGRNINTSTRPLILSGASIVLDGDIKLDGGEITLTGAIDESADTADVNGKGGNDALTVTATGAPLILNGNINTGTGDLTLSGTRIVLVRAASRTLDGGAITLATALLQAVGDITINASGNIMLIPFSPRNTNFFIQTLFGGLTLVATGGNIMTNGTTPILTVGTVSLTQMGTFAADQFTIAASVTSLTLETTGTDIDQTVHDWMVGGTNRALSITTTGALTIGRDINTGTGALTLSGTSIVLGGDIELDGGAITLTGTIDESAGTADANGKGGNDALTVRATGALTLNSDINTGAGDLSLTGATIALNGDITLSGGAITLMGGLTSSNELIITASGRLTLNSGINLGTGILTINAGERINVPTANTVIAARTFTIDFTDPAVRDPTAGFTVGDSSTLGNLAASSTTPTYTFAVDCITGTEACLLETEGNANLETDDADLVSDISITISIGTGTLTFGGSGAITIDAPTVSITAGNIDIGTRALTITASGGALTLNTRITASTTSTAAVMLSATGGELTLRGDINAGDGALSLTAASISNGGATRTLTAGTVSLTQAGAFTDNLFSIAASVTSLTLLTFETTGSSVAQTVHDWMVGGTNRALSITTTGVLTIGRDINTGTGALTLSGASIMTVGTPQLTAREVFLMQDGAFADNLFTIAASVDALTLETTGSSVAQTVHAWMVGGTNRALSLTTTGALTIGRDINTGTSALTLSGTSIVLPASNNNLITLIGGAVELTGAVDGNNSDDALDNSFTITAMGDITINDNIDLGTGALTLMATGANIVDAAGTQTLTASTVSLTQMGAFDPTAPFRFGSSVGELTLETTGMNIAQTVHAWMVGGTNRALSITTTGVLTIGRDINTDTGALSLSGASIVLGGTITLEGGEITLTGAVDGNNSDDALDNSFTITAMGDITINDNIDLGTGALTLTATGANIVDAAGAQTLTAGTVRLTQMGAFADNLFTLADTVDALTMRTTGFRVDQTVHAWMVGGTNRALNIRTTGVLTIGRNIDTGSGDLTLIGSAMTLSGVGARTLSGGTIKLQGPLSGDNALTVTAGNVLTLNNNINIGTGALSLSGASIVPGSGLSTLTGGAITLTGPLTSLFNLELTATTGRVTLNGSINLGIHSALVINVNERINLANPNTVITAGGGFRINFTNLAGVEDETAGFTIGGSSTLGNLDSSSTTPTYTFAALFANCTIAVCKLGNGTTQNLLAAFTLNAATSITIDIGTGTLTFGGRFVNNITIEAPTVSITAGNIDIGFRSLTITASNGNLTLGGDIIRGGDDVMLSAAGGALILGGDISSSRNLTLSGMTIALSGDATTTIRLEGDSVTLTGALTANAPNLTVVAADSQITLNSDIDLGAGDLTLESETGIVLGSDIELTGGNIRLGGSINESASIADADGAGGNDALTVTANGVLTLNNNINTGTGTLTLRGGRISTARTQTLTASTVSLTQMGAFDPTAPFRFGSSVGGLTLETTGMNIAQTVHAWMVGGTNRALSITTTGVLTIGRDINTGTSALTLTAASISNGSATRTLTAGTVSLTQDGAFADNLFTIVSATQLTLSTGAAQDSVYNWMVAASRALSLASTGGSITVGTAITASGNITLTATTLNINADIGIDGTPITGSLTLDGAVVFGGMNPSDARAIYATGTTFTGTITSTAALTITTTGVLTIAANITIDGGDLMLTGTGGIVIGTAGTATGRSTLAWSGDAITLAGAVTTASSNGAANLTDLTITAQGALTVAGIDLSNSDDSAYGDLVLSTGANTITFGAGAGGTLNAASVTLTQVADFDPDNRPVFIEIEGNDPGLINNPATVVISGDVQVPWARVLIVDGDLTITDGGANDPDGAPDNGIEFDRARLAYTGNITLNAGAFDITFAGTVGDTITWEAENITITAGSIMLGDRTLNITAGGGTLTLNSNILTGTGAITLQGAGAIVATGRPRLTASTVSLRQDAAFTADERGRGLFALTAGSLVITTDAEQAVHNWMIALDRNLTLTSSARVRVAIAIDASVPGRNIGTGTLTLISTGADIRIQENISTTGDITLSGSTGINLNGRAAKTLSGADITITGVVVSNRDLTLAASGTLRLNNNITTTASNLVLTGGIGGIDLGSALTLTGGGDITLTGAISELEDGLTITAAGTLTINGDDIDVGTGNLSLTGATIQIGRAADTPANTTSIVLRGQDITLTSAGGIQIGRFNMGGTFLVNNAAANLTVTASGVLTIAADITVDSTATSGGDIALTGGSIAFTGARTITGRAITLMGAATSTADLTLITTGVLTLNDNITATAGNLVLTGGGGIDLGSALTLSGGDIMLTGAIAETANGLTITADGTLTINSDIATGSGDLTLTSGTIQITRGPDDVAGTVRTLTGANITLTAANGIEIGRLNMGGTFFVNNSVANFTVTATGMLTIAADITVDSTATSGGDITLTGGGIVIGTTGSSALTWSGSNITLTGAVTTASTAGIDNFTNLTLSARGNLMVGGINLGNNASSDADRAWGDLRLRAETGTITVTGDSSAIIDAGSILFRQDGEIFAGTAGDEPANLHINGVDVSGTASLRSMVLVLSTDAQTSVDWGTVIRAGAIDLGMGDDLMIMLFNGVLNSLVSITINAGTGAVTFDGSGDITLAAPVITITAGSINANDRNLTIMTDGGTLTLNSSIDTGSGNLTLTSGTIQITRGPDDATDTTVRTLTGVNITLTAADGILLGRLNGSGIFFVNNSAANFAVTASGVLAIAADITVDSTATSGGDIMLTGDSIAFGAAPRTLSGVDITLMGNAAGAADLTITANGTLTLNSNINIGAGALTLSGAGAIVGMNTPALTASTVSLAQVDAFAAIALFTFGGTTGSLELTTTVNQEVYNWMILENTDLTVTSTSNVIVRSAIGAGETDRNLGTGDITLTSTGGVVRIFAGISTTGNLTLNGNTGINLSGGAAKILSGAAITLTGDARSNQDLTITASGTLRLNNSITLTGAGALSLSGDTLVRIAAAITTDGDITLSGGTDGINLTGADTLTGAAITLTGAARSNQDLAITASGVLTLNGGIDTGTSALSLMGATISIAGDSSITHTLSGGAITLTGAAMGAANLTITASGTLTLNNDINIGTSAI